MEDLSQEYALQINGWMILVATVIGIALVFAILISLRLISEIKKRRERKYGFLGKPLLQMFLVISLTTSFIGAYYLSQSDLQYTSEAEKEIQIDLDYKLLFVENGEATVVFFAKPVVDGSEWGEEGQSFDIIWSIIPNESTREAGQERLDFVETDRSGDRESGFNIKLLRGNYTIRIVINTQGEIFQTTQDVRI